MIIIIITVSANPKPEGHGAYTQSVCSHICIMICISYGSAMAMPYTVIVGGPTDYICLLVSSSYIVVTYNLSNLRVL